MVNKRSILWNDAPQPIRAMGAPYLFLRRELATSKALPTDGPASLPTLAQEATAGKALRCGACFQAGKPHALPRDDARGDQRAQAPYDQRRIGQRRRRPSSRGPTSALRRLGYKISICRRNRRSSLGRVSRGSTLIIPRTSCSWNDNGPRFNKGDTKERAPVVPAPLGSALLVVDVSNVLSFLARRDLACKLHQ